MYTRNYACTRTCNDAHELKTCIRPIVQIFRELGIQEKQSSAVFIAKSARVIVTENVMFNLPRAAININDGAMGGHVIARNVIFNSCRESGDHGAINSWDRQPFLHAESGVPSFTPSPITVQDNLILANYGSSQGVDNDDGSSFYHILRNVFLSADGFKMDYGGHDSTFSDNLVVGQADGYDGQACVNVGSFLPRHGDAVVNNTCAVLGSRDPTKLDVVGHVAQCSAADVTLAGNRYLTHSGVARLQCGGELLTLADVQAKGLEEGSGSGALPSSQELVDMAVERIRVWLPTLPAAARGAVA